MRPQEKAFYSFENMELNKIYNEDCLEGMKRIPDKVIDMILCDLPYGTTKNKWDSIISFEKLWEQYERIIKDNGAIVLTGSQPFTTDIIMSNRKLFRYELIWNKKHSTNFFLANKMPLKVHENILVFYKKLPTYNKQMIPRVSKRIAEHQANGYVLPESTNSDNYGIIRGVVDSRHYDKDWKNPISILEINQVKSNARERTGHPTQKPVALFEYLIKTYTNENEVVLDNCIGSGTTAVAAINTNRQFIGFEKEKEYFDIAIERIKKVSEENGFQV
ncbi:site-specific DNA-methyltransferase [Enterococcus faecalis]